MQININDKVVTLPSSLSEVTLGQRIEFDQKHGQILDQMLESILAMPEGLERTLEETNFMFEKMFRTFAFFTGCTVDAVKDSEFIDTVATAYNACLSVLVEDEQNLQLERSFFFAGETWVLDVPELKQGSRMTFGEFIDAKQLIKDMVEMGKGRWEYMLPICAIYLRKEGEAYDESFLYEDSERLELMKSLPMNIAMQVGFFLTASVNFAVNILKSSRSPEQSKVETSPKDTMKDMDGSTF